MNPMQRIRSQPRAIWWFLALCLVWMQAGNINDFCQGFLDGFAASGSNH